MKQLTLLLIISGFLFSCDFQESKKLVSKIPKSDKIYQYSVFTALANKIYDGTICVAEVKENGNLGIGTYNGLNGEMIVLDGIVYQCLSDGLVRIPDDSELVPFAIVTHFEEDYNFEMSSVRNYSDLKNFLEEKLPSKNIGYAFKLKAHFETLKCGSANKMEKPYTKTLSDALVDRPIFEMENISGTMVGFWYPEYIGKVNIAGFHLHFISDDKKQAGHVLDFKASDLKISIDYCDGFDIDLPDTEAFEEADFDLSQEYTNKK